MVHSKRKLLNDETCQAEIEEDCHCYGNKKIAVGLPLLWKQKNAIVRARATAAAALLVPPLVLLALLTVCSYRPPAHPTVSSFAHSSTLIPSQGRRSIDSWTPDSWSRVGGGWSLDCRHALRSGGRASETLTLPALPPHLS